MRRSARTAGGGPPPSTDVASILMWRCPGPDPIGLIGYSFTAAGNLEITTPSGTTILSRDTAPASSNTALTYGCIQPDGSFVAVPLAPVANQ